MRFDCNEIGDIMTEIAAYGTAVTVEPVPAAVAGVIPAHPHGVAQFDASERTAEPPEAAAQ